FAGSHQVQIIYFGSFRWKFPSPSSSQELRNVFNAPLFISFILSLVLTVFAEDNEVCFLWNELKRFLIIIGFPKIFVEVIGFEVVTSPNVKSNFIRLINSFIEISFDFFFMSIPIFYSLNIYIRDLSC